MAEITDLDPQGRFHPSLQWEPADETVAIGDLYDGEAYSKPLEPLADIAVRKRDALESGRKAAEQAGIIYNGIRYAGDPSNRQALMEALDLADTTGQTVFASWKDSDDQFHSDHLVADVRQALLDIGTRRGQLIAREGELNAQIDTALAAEDRTALETVEWSEA
ncbi:DUF4376 domain-containing protein [Halomonas salina]|uniref:DUF4376 domain-containing protein n=1 Tax=Halomonas salina TaxID=42565 RepID=UPI0009DCD575|nr:DUF4376 domain-containing protein [Halomonas salina]